MEKVLCYFSMENYDSRSRIVFRSNIQTAGHGMEFFLHPSRYEPSYVRG